MGEVLLAQRWFARVHFNLIGWPRLEGCENANGFYTCCPFVRVVWLSLRTPRHATPPSSSLVSGGCCSLMLMLMLMLMVKNAVLCVVSRPPIALRCFVLFYVCSGVDHRSSCMCCEVNLLFLVGRRVWWCRVFFQVLVILAAGRRSSSRETSVKFLLLPTDAERGGNGVE